MVDLKHLHRVTAKGRVYWYAWRGGPRIQSAHGTPAFAAEYAAHHTARKAGDTSRLSGLIAAWKTSPAWTAEPKDGGLAATTRRNWKGPLDDIQGRFGNLSLQSFNDPTEARKRIKSWLKTFAATPRAADMRKQVLSALLSYAVEEDQLTANPCFGIANIYSTDRAEIVWTADDIARFTIAAGSRELTWALELACLTGLRQSDLLRLSWSHVSDLAIELPAAKSRVRGGRGRSYVIPMYADLAALLAGIPKRATTILTNSDGHPWRAFGSSWNKAKHRMGDDVLNFHDARGTFATTTYALQVLTIAELAEMLAWSEAKVERIIRRYVTRDALLRDKIRRLDEARTNTRGT